MENIQNTIENYWSGSSERYSSSIRKELTSFKRDAWLKLIARYCPSGRSLEVLDIGTGPGFFSIILSGAGHSVKAIDCTESMLECARENAKKEGVAVEYIKMDSHKLDFPDGSFDLIVCRNLTWTLREPEKAYREWNRALKPEGCLLIFDANWHLRLFDDTMKKSYEKDQENGIKMGIRNPHEDADMDESDRIARELPLSRILRPQWDVDALKNAGFGSVFCETDITEKVWDSEEKILYKSTPMFMVGGIK